MMARTDGNSFSLKADITLTCRAASLCSAALLTINAVEFGKRSKIGAALDPR